MDKAVVYTILATAFFLLIIFLPHHQRGDDTHLALNRRLGFKFSAQNFDPMVEKLHRIAEEKGSINPEDGSYNTNEIASNINDWDNDYIGNDGKLNVTLRLLVLFPLLDNSPKDGKVSFEELKKWNMLQAMDRLYYRTGKEMEIKDKDGDGAISFEEYMPHFSRQDIEKNDVGYGEAGWWMEQFRNADVDRNGTLNIDEFNNFLHPEDSNNEEIQKWVLRGKIKRMDDDLDGKLNQEEFNKYAYDTYRTFAEYEVTIGSEIPTKESKFDELDVNHDKFLDVKELLPLLGYLKPGDLSYAKLYTCILFHAADDDGDGFLTVEEMLNHEHAFYDTVYNDNSQKEDYDYYIYHDEL